MQAVMTKRHRCSLNMSNLLGGNVHGYGKPQGSGELQLIHLWPKEMALYRCKAEDIMVEGGEGKGRPPHLLQWGQVTPLRMAEEGPLHPQVLHHVRTALPCESPGRQPFVLN